MVHLFLSIIPDDVFHADVDPEPDAAGVEAAPATQRRQSINCLLLGLLLNVIVVFKKFSCKYIHGNGSKYSNDYIVVFILHVYLQGQYFLVYCLDQVSRQKDILPFNLISKRLPPIFQFEYHYYIM